MGLETLSCSQLILAQALSHRLDLWAKFGHRFGIRPHGLLSLCWHGNSLICLLQKAAVSYVHTGLIPNGKPRSKQQQVRMK